MTRRPRDIGTAAESAVVKALRAHGFPHAERRSLKGALDQGDITGTPGICWEVKGGAAARTASDGLIAEWMAETETERINARADVGVLVVQRKGVGPANAHRWWAVLPADRLLHSSATDGIPGGTGFPVRLLLGDAIRVLRSLGYGDPISEVA